MSEGQRRAVLTEEDYTSKLSSIVERDFFPEMQKLVQQNKLLDKRLEGDLAGAIEVRRETRRLLNAQEELSARRHVDDHATTGTIRKRPRPLADESLTGFVARATNEDDHEFDSNQKREVKVNRERLRDLYDPKEASKPKNNKSRLLELASDDFLPESNRIEFQKPPPRNSLFFNPTPIHPPSQNNYHGTIKPQLLLKSDVTTEEESSLMMPPPSKQQTLSVVEQKNAKRMHKTELVEYIPKHNLEKKIEPSATRFPSRALSTIGTTSAILFEELDSSSDTDYTTDASTDLDAPLRSLEEERRRFQKKKQSRPYVAMTPQIVPGAGNESPITTWGTIDGTPIVLSGREKPEPSPFRIAENNHRESAANQAEKIMAKRTKLATSKSNKSKKRNPSTNKSLTPAALSLLEKTKPKRSGLVSALRTSYTPRPSSMASRKESHRRSSKTRNRRDNAYNATPQL
mmetsp:Transcript_10239/g.25700  ORF Transcript_10239/g.25700 Transcript_10239/m.25700 type:complete len:459 (+) Transcript_10239:152-1528(+)